MKKPEYFYWLVDENDLIDHCLASPSWNLFSSELRRHMEIGETLINVINNQLTKGFLGDMFLIKAKGKKFNWSAMKSKGATDYGVYNMYDALGYKYLDRKDIANVQRVTAPEKRISYSDVEETTLERDVYFAKYVRNLRSIPEKGEVVNLVDDLFMVFATNFEDINDVELDGQIVSPLSGQIIQYMIANYECLGFDGEAHNDNGFFASLEGKCDNISFEIKKGRRIHVFEGFMLFIDHETWKQYKSDFENNRQYPEQGSIIHVTP